MPAPLEDQSAPRRGPSSRARRQSRGGARKLHCTPGRGHEARFSGGSNWGCAGPGGSVEWPRAPVAGADRPIPRATVRRRDTVGKNEHKTREEKEAREERGDRPPRVKREVYEARLAELHMELVKMQ